MGNDAPPVRATTVATATAPGSGTLSPSAAVYSPHAIARQQQQVADDATTNEIPIRLTLGGTTLSISASGQWELARMSSTKIRAYTYVIAAEHSSLQMSVERALFLHERNELLEKENAQLREKCLRMTEESNMEKFRCQLLVEMLALSSLDEEKSKIDAEQEKARAASIQSDMLALLDQARKEGLDVRKIASVLTSPTATRP